MATKLVQDSSLTSIANAIRAKSGTSAQLEFPTDFVSAIQNIPTGGGGGIARPKDVNFYDYDGTLVDSYTASEFATLSAMPANPSYDGLTAQGWNWTLADAKAYVAKYGKLNIGQMYVTTSGDTEIDIKLSIGRNKPYLGCCPNGTVEIDWGDGSAHDTLTGTSTSTLESIRHTYPDTGELFTITLHMESGSLGFIGSSTSSTGSQVIYNGSTGDTNGQRSYQNAVKKIRCGSHVTKIGSSAFYYCYSLASATIPDGVTSIGGNTFSTCYSLTSLTIPKSVTSITGNAFYQCFSLASLTIPKGVTSIGNMAFYSCYSLTSVTIPESMTSISSNTFAYCYSLISLTIPEGITTIGNNAFGYCYSLTSVTIPEGVTSIGNSAFRYCYSLASVVMPDNVTSIGETALQSCHSLASITIPDSVTSIGKSTFSSCYGMIEYHFLPTTPPTLGTTAFSNIQSDCVIYVPVGSLEAYQTATNWSTYASYIQEESA